QLRAVRARRARGVAARPRAAVARAVARVHVRAARRLAARVRPAVPRVARARRVQPALLPRAERGRARGAARARRGRARREALPAGLGRRAVRVTAGTCALGPGIVVWLTGLP